MLNIIRLDACITDECPVGGCGKNAFPYTLAEAQGGYVDTCRDHAPMAIQECLDDGTITLPAAACPRCWGWTPMGGMSQHANGPQGCTCNRVSP